MTKYSNIFLITNLGCEMLYIIHQRLKAQNIAKDKGIQVLTDITEVLFNETLFKDLSAAETLASHEYIRTLLEDIVSVSIMRLDPFSMRKLWELMTMIFKWQLTLTGEKDLLSLTTRHLHGISKLSQLQTVQIKNCLTRTREMFNTVQQDCSVEDFVRTRNDLLIWLRDCRTNVSILLRLGFQRTDGSFIVNNVTENYKERLGSNIYSEDYSSNAYEDDFLTKDEDISELPFMINFTIAPNSENNHQKKIQFRLLEQKVNDIFYEVSNNSAISYIQSNTINVPKINESSSQSFLTSVHDDLLKLLDSDA